MFIHVNVEEDVRYLGPGNSINYSHDCTFGLSQTFSHLRDRRDPGVSSLWQSMWDSVRGTFCCPSEGPLGPELKLRAPSLGCCRVVNRDGLSLCPLSQGVLGSTAWAPRSSVVPFKIHCLPHTFCSLCPFLSSKHPLFGKQSHLTRLWVWPTRTRKRKRSVFRSFLRWLQ